MVVASLTNPLIAMSPVPLMRVGLDRVYEIKWFLSVRAG